MSFNYPKTVSNFLFGASEDIGELDSDSIIAVHSHKNVLDLIVQNNNNLITYKENILEDNSIDCLVLDLEELEINLESLRKDFRRISKNYFSDIIIFEDRIDSVNNSDLLEFFEQNHFKNSLVNDNLLSEDFLFNLYLGCYFKKQIFEYNCTFNFNELSDLLKLKENDLRNKLFKNIFNDSETHTIEILFKTNIYIGQLGYNDKEFNSKDITDFIETVKTYCTVVENYNNYSQKEFLYEIQKSLTHYYHCGFLLPESSNTSKLIDGAHEIKMNTHLRLFWNCNSNLYKKLDGNDIYYTNFDPYDSKAEKSEIIICHLSNDLAEIYEDLKSNLEGFFKNDVFSKQEALWQLKFDWKGHTGDHLTFAFRAIHWKLQEIRYD
ncbi:MAG: DUF5063 domain-containing protein [Ignavibacteria bacterium]